MGAERVLARRRSRVDRPSVLRRVLAALVLALVSVVGGGGLTVTASATGHTMVSGGSSASLPAGSTSVGLSSAGAKAQEEAPEDDDEPTAPGTDERPDEGEGPQPVVWFLAAGALLALGLGFVVMTRNQRTRP